MPARNKCCRFVVPQVVRSRLQQRMARRAIRYRSGLDVLRITLRREGVGGLYKGLLPNVLRVMPQVQFHGREQWNAPLCLLLRGPLGADGWLPAAAGGAGLCSRHHTGGFCSCGRLMVVEA